MKISVRNLEPTKVRLTITVDQEELEPHLNDARKSIANQINVPGFRKGHVPGKIVDQRVGYAAVVGEAVNEAVPEFYNNAIEEKNLRPMAQPVLDLKDVPAEKNDGVKLKFTAEVEIRPSFELPELEGMTVEVEKPEVKAEDVDARLAALQQRFGTLVGVDRPAAEGDYANINLEAVINGETVDSQDGISYELGAGNMLDGIDEALTGLSAGEKTTFTAKLAAGEHEGEEAEVKVTLNSVKTMELPELNDDFAQDASEFDTLDELKADITKQLESESEGRQANAARDAFLEKVVEGLEIPVPKGLLAEHTEEHLRNMGKTVDNATAEEKKEASESAEKEMRDQILLDTLAEKMDVQVSQSDVMNFLASVAQQYGMDPNNFINSIIQGGQLPSAVQEVARSKGLLTAMRAVTFKDTEGNVVDLSRFLGSDEDEASDEDQSVAAASAAAAVADEVASADAE
ncbi:trigger factor [Alloscardovia macacae]|uniref:Trigger factor n=1 Tax=Alloscardovia macacae TaxID=1160091 RepID=A0A1Y2SWC9_9BIFI|nr:trigger factor [Alloscardovia macacae]OTA27618.1 trigger factor [Alloscardovia macacae]OTA30264.1 trigger factor [Alloscardovia macacae]OZG54365.1 trigger factor [Alloscardovia macacae]